MASSPCSEGNLNYVAFVNRITSQVRPRSPLRFPPFDSLSGQDRGRSPVSPRVY